MHQINYSRIVDTFDLFQFLCISWYSSWTENILSQTGYLQLRELRSVLFLKKKDNNNDNKNA